MEMNGKVEVRFNGVVNGEPLRPEIFDIRELAQLLKNIEPLLYPGDRRGRPIVSYRVEEGSVKHIFSTTLQAAISFSSILSMVSETGNLDGLEPSSAYSIEAFQEIAVNKGYEITFSSPNAPGKVLKVTPDTHYYKSEPLWVDAEVYLYGMIEDAGGKDKVNIHLVTEEGNVRIAVSKDQLRDEERNPLYKRYGIRAKCRQNAITGEIDKDSLKLISMTGYEPLFDQEAFDKRLARVGHRFAGIDADEYVREIRGEYAG